MRQTSLPGYNGRRRNVNSWSLWSMASLLLGSASLASADKTAADYYVHSLPGQPAGPLLKMHAGHIEIDAEHNGNLFFWHYENRHIANRQRTVVWLNGGPGCSSMDGAMMEIGPYRVKEDLTLEYNEGGWDEFANLLFIDQPVGTGFSYVNSDSYVHELDEMATQFITFLEKWFAIFPEYEQDDLYFSGESYAGQYIPYIGKWILDRNIKVKDDKDKHQWNLQGLIIGNGWIDPVNQYTSTMPFAYKENLITAGSDAAKQVESAHQACISKLAEPGKSDQVDLGVCENVMHTILRLTRDDAGDCYNMYDVRKRDTYPSCGMNWPESLPETTKYLRLAELTKAIHINADKNSGWTECAGAVSSAFNAKNSKPSINILPEILESGVPITLFSGAKDLICNHVGTEELIHNMKWSDGTGFELSPGVWAPRLDWTFEGELAGYWQEARNLTYVLFYNASHMVPWDYPRRTRDMLDRVIGVDIGSIGGIPADSRIGGEKGLETSVGGVPNSTAAVEAEKQKLEEAEWKAYYKSGEAALVVVAIAASVWGIFVWRDRRRRAKLGYQGVYGADGADSNSMDRFVDGIGNAFRMKGKQKGRTGGGAGGGVDDLEAADFDESELDDLHNVPDERGMLYDAERERFKVDDDDFSDDGDDLGKHRGHAEKA